MRFIDRCISTIATKVPRLAGAKMAVYRLAGVQCEGCDFRGGSTLMFLGKYGLERVVFVTGTLVFMLGMVAMASK